MKREINGRSDVTMMGAIEIVRWIVQIARCLYEQLDGGVDWGPLIRSLGFIFLPQPLIPHLIMGNNLISLYFTFLICKIWIIPIHLKTSSGATKGKECIYSPPPPSVPMFSILKRFCEGNTNKKEENSFTFNKSSVESRMYIISIHMHGSLYGLYSF